MQEQMPSVSSVVHADGFSQESMKMKNPCFVKRLYSAFKDKYQWKYECWWEDENAEMYDRDALEGEESFIVEQRWVNAKEIQMAEMCMNEKDDFPWHGHTFEDFIRLDKKLQSCREAIDNIRCAKDVERFRRKNREVYDAYFSIPICVLNKEGVLSFSHDGRHRIFAAVCNNGELPVWVLEYKKSKDVDREFFKKHVFSGNWRFLNEF